MKSHYMIASDWAANAAQTAVLYRTLLHPLLERVQRGLSRLWWGTQGCPRETLLGECREGVAFSAGVWGVPSSLIPPFQQEGGDAEGVGIPCKEWLALGVLDRGFNSP